MLGQLIGELVSSSPFVRRFAVRERSEKKAPEGALIERVTGPLGGLAAPAALAGLPVAVTALGES